MIAEWMKTGAALFVAVICLAGCGNEAANEKAAKEQNVQTGEDSKEESHSKEESNADENGSVKEETEIYVFIAKSLSNAMEAAAEKYKETHPKVTITYNAESSGTLQTQIEEGFACDLFFSAGAAQMDALNQGGFLEADTITNLLGNKLCLITYKGSGTAVTGFADMSKAADMALANGSVPVGQYTRQLLVNMGIITAKAGSEPAQITTAQVKAALGNIEINECANVGVVAEAVKEGSNEIGTVYYSDAYAVRDDIEIIEEADPSLLGEPICYPLALVRNKEADEAQRNAAIEFYEFLLTDECMEIFENFMFTRYSE